MGSSQSAPRLQVRLLGQPKPFLATSNGVVAETFTTLRVKPPSFSTTMKVFDVHTNQLAFNLKSGAFTSRRTLETPNGRVLVSVKSASFSSKKIVYDGDQTDHEAFRIIRERHIFSESFMFTEFQDRSSGDACRVIVEGNSYDRVVLVYIEHGINTLPPVNKLDDRTSSRFQPIGRFCKVDNGLFSSEEFNIEAAPGVDLSLLLLLWRVRYDVECERRTAAASTSTS